jgi:hypothetical protein
LNKINGQTCKKINGNKYLSNSFTVLDSYDDDDDDDDELETIAANCDIVLGDSREETTENINAIRMEERVRAALAEANYKNVQEVKLITQHALETENLSLEPIENS